MVLDKWIGILLSIIGIVVIVGLVAADLTGLGSDPGFGAQQTTGLLIGVLLLVAGEALVKGWLEVN